MIKGVEEMQSDKSIPIKQVTRPEGFNGHTVKVWLVFDCESGLTIEAHPHGFHNSHVPRELGELQSGVRGRFNI